MASSAELVLAICHLIKSSPAAIPITLKNHGAELAAVIIGSVIEECHRQGIQLGQVTIDAELADELGLPNGKRLSHGSRPILRHDTELRGQVRFERVSAPIA